MDETDLRTILCEALRDLCETLCNSLTCTGRVTQSFTKITQSFTENPANTKHHESYET